MSGMAGTTVKHADNTNVVVSEVFKGQALSFNHSKMESCNGSVFENEKHSSLNSPCKSLDPARKKMFKITSVKKGASGDVLTDNDADSVDGLDESQTDDFSSEFYDNSKVSELDMDIQDYLNMPALSPDEVTGTTTTTILVKQKPDQNSQSRFKVVKIETKEPFRRGKWICYDFYDTTSGTVVTVERTDTKVTEVEGWLSSPVLDHLNSSSSVHGMSDVANGSSSTTIRGDGYAAHFDGFVPIQPAPANQVLSQLDGLSSDMMAPFIAQQVLMSVAGIPSSSNSFQNLAQTGHPTIIQSMAQPHANLFPYDQNAPPVGLFQNGLHSDGNIMPSDTNLANASNGAPAMLPTGTPAISVTSNAHNQTLMASSGMPVLQPSSSQTQIAGDSVDPHGVSSMTDPDPNSSIAHFSQRRIDIVADQLNPTTMESSERIIALQGVVSPSEKLKEAVEAVGGMYIELGDNNGGPDDGEGSSVAIDNKIEQAMDLVKRHLMYAVREEVEILKQQIGELVERIVQLEHENTVLKSEAKPETLNKLQQTRGTQPSQASLPGQSTSFTMVPSSQQGGQQATNPMPQTQPSQQYQQTTTPHSMSQAQPSQQYQQTTTPHSVSQTQPSQQYQQTTTPHSVSQAQPSQQYQQTTTPHSMSQAQPSQQYQQTTTSHSVSQAQPSQQTVQTTST